MIKIHCSWCFEEITDEPFVQKMYTSIKDGSFYHTKCFVLSHEAHSHEKVQKLEVDLGEAVRCLENAIKFVYHYYGDNKEALADMETATWKIFVRDHK